MNDRVTGLFNRRMLICATLGFSSGLPYYVLVSLLPAWLRTEGVGLAEIALFSWLRVPYTWKFLWAPLVDRFNLGLLGRRRDWAIITQVLILLLLATLGWYEPEQSISTIASLVLLVAVFSATQDIAIDAYRRELLPDLELGMGNALAVNAYRVSGLVAGGLALFLADRMPWNGVFLIVALFMLVGIVTSLLAPDAVSEQPPRDLRTAILGPFREFFQRGELGEAWLMLAFLFFYKLGDNLATTLATPFYIDLGFSLTEIGTLVKVIALWAMVGGSLIGGAVIARIGINRALWIFGLVQMGSILGFAVLAEVGRNLWVLAVVVLFEYLGIGLGTAAFVAFIARATNKQFTATQFALFSSFIALPGIAAGSTAGFLVEWMGYTWFFVGCTALAIPGLLLLPHVAPWNAQGQRPAASQR